MVEQLNVIENIDATVSAPMTLLLLGCGLLALFMTQRRGPAWPHIVSD